MADGEHSSVTSSTLVMDRGSCAPVHISEHFETGGIERNISSLTASLPPVRTPKSGLQELGPTMGAVLYTRHRVSKQVWEANSRCKSFIHCSEERYTEAGMSIPESCGCLLPERVHNSRGVSANKIRPGNCSHFWVSPAPAVWSRFVALWN